MSIQSTASSYTKPEPAGGKDDLSSILTKHLVENPDLSSIKDELTPPKFGTILGSLNEIQSSSLSSKKTASQSYDSNNSFRKLPCKNNDPVSHPSLVKPTEGGLPQLQLVSDNKESLPIEFLEADPVTDGGDSITGMPLSLGSHFIQDTLQGINYQQNLVFEAPQEIMFVKGQTLPFDGEMPVIVSSPVDLVHIEVQAAPVVYTEMVLDDQQYQAIAALEDDERPKIEKNLSSGEQDNEDQDDADDTSQRVITQDKESDQKQQYFDKQNNHQMATAAKAISLPSPRAASGSALTPGGMGGQMPLGPTLTSPGSNAASFSSTMTRSNLDRVNTLMQVKDHFQSMLQNKETHLKVNLMPQDLGRIEITLEFSKDAVISTMIRAERRETMEFLATHAQDLDEIFQKAGLQSSLANMNFSSEQDSQTPFETLTASAASTGSAPQSDITASLTSADEIDLDALVDIKA